MQEKIRDYEIWKFYSENHYFNIDDTKQEIINLNIRSNAKDEKIKNLEDELKILKEENLNLQTKLNTGFFRKVQAKLDSYKNN